MIDNRPLQDAAWAELVRARKRLEKATHDVHRHEETDEPAFRSWLARTFPALLSAVRTLAEQVAAKIRIVQAVESESFFTGRPPSRIWREWQQNGGRPPERDAEEPAADDHGDNDSTRRRGNGRGPFPDEDAILEEEMRRMFAEEGIDDDDPATDGFREFARATFGFGSERGPRIPPAVEADARETYRRLVRHLHPDRGGAWTPARARLWEQVQAAWSARDADWLARLEAEWEARTDRLGPTSAVGRLRAALAEIDAARRDAEKRVRAYRKHEAWRFSLQPPSDELGERMRRQLQRDESVLRAQLDELEMVTAGWERTASRHRAKKRREVPQRYGFRF